MTLSFDQSDAVRRATHTNLISFWRLFPSSENGNGLTEIDGVAAIDFGIPHPLLRGVLGSQLDSGSEVEIIDREIERFRKLGGAWSWIIAPDCAPSNLSVMLVARGMAPAFQMPGMAIDLDNWQSPPMPAGLEIRFLENTEDLESWLKLCFDVFEIPEGAKSLFRDLHADLPIAPGDQIGYVLGLLDGKPVATANYCIGNGVVGIYCVATLEEARGNGIASALVGACLEMGREFGYRVGILQSSSRGHNAYERLGFEDVSWFDVFLDSAENPSPE